MSYVAFLPHLIAMIFLGIIALRPTPTVGSVVWMLTITGSLMLSGLNRVLPWGLAPPLREDIGWKGWIATIITASVPLLAVVVAARVARRRLGSPLGRWLLLGSVGLLALVAYPFYGMLLYCGFTAICP